MNKNRSNICHECINKEFYGPFCNYSCKNCPGECDINGICIDNKTNCDDDTFTGDKCDILCNVTYDNCLRCNRDNICHECINKEFYGPFCNYSCENCPGECNIDGICDDQIHDCDDKNFTGPKCDIRCNSTEVYNNCETCDRNNTCYTCFDSEFYGDFCNISCANCPGICFINGTCVNDTALCDDNSFTGPECTTPCNEKKYNCRNCTRDNTCLECFDRTLFGDNCTEPCYNCPGNGKGQIGFCHIDGICDNQTSLCVNDSYTGPKCDKSCTSLYNGNCKRCDRNETCIECIDQRFHGDTCETQCYGCGKKGCDVQGYCKEFKCTHGTFGLKCNETCHCRENSNSIECGKFEGQCIDCKFGYYGKHCENYCYYKCKSELCCLFKDTNHTVQGKLKLSTYYKYFDVTYNGKTLKIEIDYNYGYPLTIFNQANNLQANEQDDGKFNANFTNYFITNGTMKKNQNILINGHEIKNIDLIFVHQDNVERKSGKNDSLIKGVIGLGFFNSISNSFFPGESGDETIELNILSYAFDEKDDDDEITLYFGDIDEVQKDYVDRLTDCTIVLDNNTDIQGKKMTCILDGIKSSKYTAYYKLDNAYITFSLGEKSSLILGNNTNYLEYLQKAYFKEEIKPISRIENNITIYGYLYPKSKINKLSDFGFVINKYFYSYSPDMFFEPSTDNDYYKFLIEYRNDTERTDFIIGKEFLKKIKFTINNEEAKIYFYAQNAELSEVPTNKVESGELDTKMEPKELAAICLAVIVFLNLFAFGIYFLLKKRKMKSNEYMGIK